ncbi:MAG: galactose-1-phosphate uridylyltransferase, UDPglucose-hexose-1-phosphate uridylyltransferase [Candidatus Gottesmanbacteria bacterium GW2011_GWA2_43_14]|uniref:Galactose-1-phosphate uridylyltransferase, UDPglucose-hexose-1-phosphate uridylyltransferase n=1 Tax=Candidatus Gottesmanbacteria bacterium GW2011_GWA2_43_14 TaxID=1618443 RepID=A0A0G1GF90_9BACT|nr:MAG: galactose-1-phosphate uridylyltransferase, UDPglucose-hexose-1-phosphate uridylyltransferase [Candidatus Gottesmanbacteria bacterium GW2011_GWA2_43_14]
MAKFVPDIKTQRWIVISQTRTTRPDEHEHPADKQKPAVCVFCTGNEAMTPSEIMRVGDGEKDKPGWKVRVVPNKYPITDTHEVIIHSPEHSRDIAEFDLNQVNQLLLVYRNRFQAHAGNGQVMLFCNHGNLAGASLNHPHSQLVLIPRQINLDALVREPIMNVVDDNHYFVTYCPDFSQWPYEVWISPKKDGTVFGDVSDEELKDLSQILQYALKRLKVKYHQQTISRSHSQMPFSYNFYIHHAKNWFLRIIPRLVHRAGFELGTGLSVNVVDPTIAAEELKEIKVGLSSV